jgi:DNA-binding transcriptional MerR regulator/methylmalonyl-CoA mutase cobalamin-binding subunit
MYTIKQAGARSGVSVPLLRAWERRYGIVSPARTASGYRLYDDAAVERLLAMRRLVDEGWTASEAARAVIAGEVSVATARDALDQREPAAAQPGDLVRPMGATPYGAIIESFVDAASRVDVEGVELALDQAFALGAFELVAEEIVLPALGALGDAWRAGRVDVAGEHAASHAVGRRLAVAFAAAARTGGEAGLLVGLPPGSRHELGALAFATAARRAGLPVVYLGADVPAASWIEAARRTQARGAVVTVPTDADARPAAAVLEGLQALGDRFVCAAGGSGTARLPPVRDLVRLPASLSAAAATLSAMLDAGGADPRTRK